MAGIYERTGDFTLPIPDSLVTGNLAVLDPVRGRLLALFKAALEAELAAAWNAVGDTALDGRSVVQSTLELEPNHQHMQELKTEFPLLALHRSGETTIEQFTLETDQATQTWQLHYVLGALKIDELRKLGDILFAVPRVVHSVIRKHGHPAFENGALQFHPGTGGLQRIKMLGSEAGQAAYGAGPGGTLYYAVVIRIETVETVTYVEGAEGDFDGVDYTVGVGGGEGVLPGGVLGNTDPEYQEP